MTALSLPGNIIHHSSATQSLWLRARDILLCAGLWYIYYILMQDFFHFVATIMAWEVFGDVRPGLPAAFKILATIKDYALVVVALGCLLISWAIYNKARFSRKERRKHAPVVSINDLGLFYNLNPEDIASWRQARTLTIHHDRHGNLVGVNAHAPRKEAAKTLESVAA